MKKGIIFLVALVGYYSTLAQGYVYDSPIIPEIFDNSAMVAKQQGITLAMGYQSISGSSDLQYGYASWLFSQVGVGATLYRAAFPIASQYSFMGNAAYRIDLDRNNSLSFGINLGVDYLGIDTSKAKIYDQAGVNVVSADTYLSRENKGLDFNFGGGVLFQTDTYFLGVSVPRLLVSDIWQTHYYALAGLHLDMNDYFRWTNSTQVRYLHSGGFRTNITSKIQYDDQNSDGVSYAALGASYSWAESVTFFSQMDVPQTNLELGVGYRLFVGDFKQYSPWGVFEFHLKYNFKGKD